MPVRENSSIPLCLGAWHRATTPMPKHAPPGVNEAETSLFFCPRQEDETPCPSNSRGRCKCNHHHQHFTGPSQVPISTCRFPPHFRKGEEAMKGKRRTHRRLTTAHGVYGAAVTSLARPHHITHIRQQAVGMLNRLVRWRQPTGHP